MPPTAPAGLELIFAAVTALSSLSTDDPALLANFVTGVFTLETSRLQTVSTTFSSMSTTGCSWIAFSLSTMSSMSDIALGACDISTPLKKHSGGGTSKAPRIFFGASSMNFCSCFKRDLKASTAPPKMLFNPSKLPRGLSMALTSKHFFIGSVSILAMSPGSETVSAKPCTSFGNLESFFKDASSSFMALAKVSESFFMGSVISPAIFAMVSPSLVASSAKSPNFAATAFP
mmetsp:Transcript_51635/g.122896  ORF Transcript_51635/g.122896 Transcript_51635/m.122896 type:complete len:231 (+) Transcript_51635:250-942(+)